MSEMATKVFVKITLMAEDGMAGRADDSVARGPIALMVGQVSGNQHSRGAQLYSCCKTHNKSVGVVTHARGLVSCVMFVS